MLQACSKDNPGKCGNVREIKGFTGKTTATKKAAPIAWSGLLSH
jgi:hypothetical protein